MTKCYVLHFFSIFSCSENVLHCDPKSEVQTEQWILCTVTPLLQRLATYVIEF